MVHTESVDSAEPPINGGANGAQSAQKLETYAQVFTGVRQDSGNPKEFVARMRRFYDSEGVTQRKTIVFSDSLNTERCIEYRAVAEAAGFAPSFGVGTFFTSRRLSLCLSLSLSKQLS